MKTNLSDDRVYRKMLDRLARSNREFDAAERAREAAERRREQRERLVASHSAAVQLYRTLKSAGSAAFDVGNYDKCTRMFRAAKALKAAYA